MHSFYNFDYIKRLQIKFVTQLLIKAAEKRDENRAWDLYISIYPHMTSETYIPFEEFYNPWEVENKEKTVEEILGDVKNIIDNFNKGVNDEIYIKENKQITMLEQ